MSLTEFLNMGGYAFYVWSAYALGFVVLVGNLIYARVHDRQARKRIASRLSRTEART